jgi:23S rRNA pseudouridine1911/1915/1917 synthase
VKALEQIFHLQIQSSLAGERLDKAVSELVEDMTRSSVQKLIELGHVTKNGTPLNKSYRVSTDDCIDVAVPEPAPLEVKAESIPLEIMYEDDDLLVVNKPKGMVVHPAAGNHEGTLVNALLAHCGDSLSGINGVIRPGIVHRIDKDTSGLLIVAKNDFAHQKLAAQIKAHTFTRMYEAAVYGSLKESDGTIDAPIGRHPTDRKRMAVTEKNSRNAVTHYHVLAAYDGFTHVQLKLETGRTHQIRVHMAYIGHPVAGDPVYGPKKVITTLHGQCLHARVIGFIHPRDGRYIEITSDLPDYFTGFLKQLKTRV